MSKQAIQNFYETTYQYQAPDSKNFDNYERNRVLKRIYHNGTGKKILDLGAGNGKISQFFLDCGYDVYGIEWTKAGVEHLTKIGVKAQKMDLEKFPYDYENEYFDEIFWGDNIEHLYFPETVTKEIYRILKPGGRLVLSTPNHGWIINRLYYLFMGVPRRTEGQKTKIWEWQHIRYFNKPTIKEFLNHCGFTQNFRFYAAERRQPFSFLSQYFPAIMGSVMIIEICK